MGWILDAFILLGLLAAAASAVVIYKFHKTLRASVASPRRRALTRALCILVSLPVGAFFAYATYPISSTQKITGVPIPAAVWEWWNGSWSDFVSALTLPAMIADAVVGAGVVHALTAVVLKCPLAKQRRASTPELQ